MNKIETFHQLLERVRRDEAGALEDLIQQYESELRLVARNRIGPALRPHLDSMDLVQSVNKSLILGLRLKKFNVTSREGLMGLVALILRRKVARHWRKHRRQQRDSMTVDFGRQELVEMALAFRDRGEDPERLAIQQEALGKVFEKLDATEKKLVQLRLEGYSTAEAARMMEVDPDILRVRLSRLRRRLREGSFSAEWL